VSSNSTEAQVVYERIEELKREGMSNAEAIRAVTAERGKKENAVRANQHQYRQRLKATGGAAVRPARSGRGRIAKSLVVSVEDTLAQARGVLEAALTEIDGEVEAAKADLGIAQARYNAVLASAQVRKAELKARLKTLT
jgi:uncharacterized protein YoaH (UPF0181 family)